jgi:hypothetical protein
MDRRAFVTPIAGACLLEALAVRAQQAGKVFRVGLLVPRTEPVSAGDPVGAGFAATLARPGGNLTGTSLLGEEILAKQVELLSAAVPKLQKVTVLMNAVNPANGFFFALVVVNLLQRADEVIH